ncbi:MAG: hypothetical protein LBK62_14020, partial [Treponema sp.]|nr:hypothetical protein [Treponema sp.]
RSAPPPAPPPPPPPPGRPRARAGLDLVQSGPQTQRFISEDAAGNTYDLTITEKVADAKYVAKAGDRYRLVITYIGGSTKISNGTVSLVSETTLTLSTATAGELFTVTINSTVLTGISGQITFDGEQTPTPISETLQPPGGGSSEFSAPVPAVTAGNGQITVTWFAVSDAVAYDVYCDTAAVLPGTASISDTANTTETITGLSNGSVYYIWVKAKNAAGEEAVNAKPVAAAPWDTGLMTQFVGVWDSYSDSYIISASGIKYDDGFPNNHADFASNVRYAFEYSADTGVIIIEYSEAPGSPYTGGISNFEGIYYKTAAGGVKFANAYTNTQTDIPDLATAVTTFSPANESTFVPNWSGVYAQYKQPGTVIDMGALRGTWAGDDNLYDMGVTGSTMLKISDYRLTVYWGPISPGTVLYSGTIVERTDPSAASGYIYIQFTQPDDAGNVEMLLDAAQGDYYAIYWSKEGGKTRFSAYNDHLDNTASSLSTLKTHSDVNPYFLEADDPDYEGEGAWDLEYAGLSMGGYIYVGFTKQ